MEKPWAKSVTIDFGGEAGTVTISNTTQASWALIEDWPLDEAPALDRALDICSQVIEGRMKPEEARKAFIAAAMEAELPIGQ